MNPDKVTIDNYNDVIQTLGGRKNLNENDRRSLARALTIESCAYDAQYMDMGDDD